MGLPDGGNELTGSSVKMNEREIMTMEESSKRQEIRVLGVGNSYRNDDGIGLLVARQLHARNLPDVKVLEIAGDVAGLMEAWKKASSVILVDAVTSELAPGTVVRLDARSQVIPSSYFRYSTHAFSIAESIELAKVLGTLPERLIVFGIVGGDFGMGTKVSQSVLDAGNSVVGMILTEIESNVEIPVSAS